MRTPLLLVAATSLLLAVAAPASAQDVGIQNPETSTPTTLYFHLINVQDMPINTQIPNDKFVDLGTWGTFSHTLSCVNDLTGNDPNLRGALGPIWHTMYGYSSPSYVEYDFQQNGQPRTHPERGISYDAQLDTNTPFTLHWYMATQYGVSGVDPLNMVPAPVPNVVVAASMKTGDAISIDDKGYDGGQPIVTGKTKPALLVPSPVPGAGGAYTMDGVPTAHDQVTMTQVDGKYVWHFAVPMNFDANIIPRSTGFNVRIDVYIENPACSDVTGKNYIMPNVLAGYTDKTDRPRMEFAVNNPIRLEYLHPQFVGDDLVVHTSMNSVWGNYDVGEVNGMTPQVTEEFISVRIDGPSPATSLDKAAVVQRTHEHYHHQEAVDITYVWPYKTDRAQNGEYTVLVEFMNDAGNAKAVGTAKFEVGKGTVIGCGGVQEASQKLNDDCAATIQKDGITKAEESPGLPLVGLLGALVVAVAVVLRRKA